MNIRKKYTAIASAILMIPMIAFGADKENSDNEKCSKAARDWVMAIFENRPEYLTDQAATPFCLYNEMKATKEVLHPKLGDFLNSPDVAQWNKLHKDRVIAIVDPKVLEGERESFVAKRSFSHFDTGGKKLVLVRVLGFDREQRQPVMADLVVVVDPNDNFKVVGFGDD